MKIYKEEIRSFLYVFDYTFSMQNLEFCRYIKNTVGWQKFNFYNSKWRFNDLGVIELLKGRYNDLEISEDVALELEQYRLAKRADAMLVKNAEVIKQQTDTDFVVNNINGELYPYQRIGVQFFVNNNGRAILADQMGCLSGDTIIQVNRGGNCRKYKLKDAYIGFNNLNKKKNYNWRLESYTRSYNEETKEFALNKIKKIIYSGVKDTIIINAKSKNKKYSIELTPDHKIATNAGWFEAKNLLVGDKIITNGRLVKFCPVCKIRTEHSTYKYSPNNGKCKKCIYRFCRDNKNNDNYESIDKSGYILVGGLYFHPNFKQIGNNGIRKHILVYEAMENDITYDELIEMCRYNNLPINFKFIDSSKYSIHHIDGNKQNNNIENLQKLLIKEHCKLEGSTKTYKNLKATFIPDEAIITSIVPSKKRDVYDVVMEDPHRNFIANGVVVHNCGKSLQALAYVAHTKKERTLIICPASVKYSWEAEIKKWTNFKSFIIDSGLKNKKTMEMLDEMNKHDIFIINYDIVKSYLALLRNTRWDCLIADEFHYIKNNSAQRTKAVKEIAANIPSVILMSGTPLLSRPIELFNGLHIMDPHTWNNWFEYAKKYCQGHYGPFGLDTRGASNIDELQDKISRYFLRRKKEEVLKELPEKTHIDFPVELSAEKKFEYSLVEDSFVQYLKEIKNKKDEDIRRTMQAEKLVKLGELRQITSSGKIDAAKDLIAQILDNDEKVVVFSNYNEPLEALEETFRNVAVKLTGDTPVLMRKAAIESFQNDPSTKVFLGGMKSAGVGITLTAGKNVIFIDYSWVPSDHLQAEDRIHRIGSEFDHVTIYQLFAKDTIDEKMKEMLGGKQDIFNQVFNDGETGATKSLTNSLLKEYGK